MLSNSNAPHFDDTVGGRMSLAREAKAISVDEAARRLGVLASSWSAWECDRDVPRANRLANMAGILGVSPTWLLTGLGEGPGEWKAGDDQGGLRQAIRQMSEDVEALNKRMRELTSRLENEDGARA